MSTTPLTEKSAPDQTAILALLRSLRQAHHDKNAAAIAACYEPEAVICDLSPPLYHRGIDVIRKQAWLDSWDGPIELEPRDYSFTIDGDTAFAQGYTRMAGSSKAAGGPISFWLRDTICLRRGAGGWKIAHIHSSVPFYMDGGLRPAFDLEP